MNFPTRDEYKAAIDTLDAAILKAATVDLETKSATTIERFQEVMSAILPVRAHARRMLEGEYVLDVQAERDAMRDRIATIETLLTQTVAASPERAALAAIEELRKPLKKK